MKKKRPLCIIPARGGSKRLPRKNLALLAGSPLLAYAVEAAFDSGVFERICVSSEDEEILELAERLGASALPRPPRLADDDVQVKEVCRHILESFAAERLEYEEFGLLLVTNPLRTGDDIRNAYMLMSDAGVNSVISLVEYSHPPQRAVRIEGRYVVPYFSVEQMKRAQDLRTLYRHDGSVLFIRTDVFLKERELYTSQTVPYHLPRSRSVDIDDALDLEWAEFLLAHSARTVD